MAEQIKQKIDLNRVTHSVRAAQAVLQYGVGAMVDFPDQTLVTAAPEYWSGYSKIYDDRFAKALGVDWFALPTNIAYSRFPEWYFCPKCRTFQPLKDWIAQYKAKAHPKLLESDSYMVQHMQCPKCKQDLVVARIVTVCENGHLNDFPWIKWVHAKAKKPICAHPELKFKTGASATEGLEGLSVSCACGASTTLKGAFDKDAFEKTDADGDTSIFRCEGGHPFRHSKEGCGCYPRTVQRGASSVYFPVVYSSLVIPPYADKLNAKIESSKAFEDCITIINDEDDEDDKLAIIKKRFSKWVERISLEIGVSIADVEKILTRKWLEPTSGEIDVTSVQYRIEEYLALSGELESPTQTLGDFLRESISIQEYGIPHVKSVSLIEKVRVVNALIGFSRLNPIMNKEDKGFVSIKEPRPRWYPAYEVRGEGIFIEFNQEEIDSWIASHPSINERVQRIAENYRKSWLIGRMSG